MKNILYDYNENIPDISGLLNIENSFEIQDKSMNKITVYVSNLPLLLYYNLIAKDRSEFFLLLVEENNLSKQEVKDLIKPYLKFYKGSKEELLRRLNHNKINYRV